MSRRTSENRSLGFYLELPQWALAELKGRYPEKSYQAAVKQLIKDSTNSTGENNERGTI